MSGVEAGIWGEGTWLNGQYLNPNEYRACLRCGVVRRVRPKSNDLCGDCKTVEHHATRCAPEPVNGYQPVRGPAGIVRFQPIAEPMSAEDRAWCERQVERHFWEQWERGNRSAGVSEQMIQLAIRKVA